MSQNYNSEVFLHFLFVNQFVASESFFHFQTEMN